MERNRTNKLTQQKEQKSRAKYQCPQKLAKLIEVVNLIPPEAELPDWEETFSETADYPLTEENKIASYEKTLEECLSKLPKGFKKYLFEKKPFDETQLISEGVTEPMLTPLLASIRYLQFREFRDDFREIVTYFSKMRLHGNVHPYIAPRLKVSLEIHDDKAHVLEGLAEAVNGIKYERLRFCKICNRIFWANNKNSETCSKSCLNALRQRRHRQKNKEEINAKRRENYAQNKKLKEMRKKKNGTL